MVERNDAASQTNSALERPCNRPIFPRFPISTFNSGNGLLLTEVPLGPTPMAEISDR